MRVGIYTRVSTEEQALHGISLDAQKDSLVEYAKLNNYEIYNVYTDEGLSATTLDRPGLLEMLEDIKMGLIDLVLITKLDRLSRGVGNYYKIAEIMESNNCGWKTILENYDSTTANGRLHINIMLSVAENEAAVTRERINFVIQNKLKNKEVISGNKLYGYDMKDKHYVINEDEAEVVRYVFDEYPKCLNVRELRDRASIKFNSNFTIRLITSMLKRVLYTGYYDYKGELIPDYAPKIIDEEQFKHIQGLLKVNGKPKKSGITIHVFSKIIRCHKDCLLCISTKDPKRSGLYTYIECKRYKCEFYKNGECKGVKNKREDKFEELIINDLAKHLNENYKLYLTKKETVKTDNSDIKKKLKSVKKKMSKLEDMYLDDLIGEDKYKKRYKEYKKEMEIYTTKIMEDENLPTFKSVNDDFIESINTGAFKDIYYSLSTTERHAFWGNLVKNIIFLEDGSYKIIFR